ncbi:hypothetical protein LJR231_003858 [Phyllobacterium sp. LjRoot231]|uniref:hypothetical protein n=1 Tax=Phyllobacterium sp. LjRoot231 TaxID=3342289 RepID=UPI003ECE11BE
MTSRKPLTQSRPTNRRGTVEYVRLISWCLTRWYALPPLEGKQFQSLVSKLQRLQLEIAVEHAHLVYGGLVAKQLTGLISSLDILSRFANDPKTEPAKSRLASRRLSSGISVSGWMAQAEEAYAIIRADAGLVLLPEGGLFESGGSITSGTIRTQMISKTLPELYRTCYPRRPFEMRLEQCALERWGPGPLFIAIVARFLGLGAVTGEQIHKAMQRLE